MIDIKKLKGHTPGPYVARRNVYGQLLSFAGNIKGIIDHWQTVCLTEGAAGCALNKIVQELEALEISMKKYDNTYTSIHPEIKKAP